MARPGSGFLSAILPSGMRAIAVRISASNTAGGFILPGDRVDVVQTVAQQASSDAPAENVSRTILSNIKVLAIDQTVGEKEGEAAAIGKTATLELDPAQVELITAAEASGTLSLALAKHGRRRRSRRFAGTPAKRNGAYLPGRPQPNHHDSMKSPDPEEQTK